MKPTYKVTLRPVPWNTIEDADSLADSATDWLRCNSRSHHLLMVYLNDGLGITFVFNDPNTAILFRLAM